MKTFEQFVKNYELTKRLDMGTTIRRPTKPLNEKQLLTAYRQYKRKIEKQAAKQKAKKEKPLSKDAELSLFIRKRDKTCRLLQVLTPEELSEWKQNHNGIGYTLDAAHVFGKGANPSMRFITDNIVLLNRFSHNSLDTNRNPLNGSIITQQEKENWWQRIVGEKTFNELLLKKDMP